MVFKMNYPFPCCWWEGLLYIFDSNNAIVSSVTRVLIIIITPWLYYSAQFILMILLEMTGKCISLFSKSCTERWTLPYLVAPTFIWRVILYFRRFWQYNLNKYIFRLWLPYCIEEKCEIPEEETAWHEHDVRQWRGVFSPQCQRSQLFRPWLEHLFRLPVWKGTSL